MMHGSQVEVVSFPFDQVPAPPQCRNAMRSLGRLEKLLSRTTPYSRKSSLAASRPPSVRSKCRSVKPFCYVALQGHSLQHLVLMAMPSGANLRRTRETSGSNHSSVQSHPAVVTIIELVCLFLSDDCNFPAAAAVAATEA